MNRRKNTKKAKKQQRMTWRRHLPGLVVLMCLPMAWFYLSLPDVRHLETIDRGLTIRVEKIGDEIRRGDVVANLQISLENMPEHLIQAFIAAEDRQFYSHHGVNLRGLGRALSECLANALRGTLACGSGGSGITQQLVKNTFLHFDRSPLRKLREMVLAWQLEWHYSKDEILRTYLNTIYLGHHSFGVQVAARRYFQKDVRDLNLLEAAILVGSNPRPARENIRSDPTMALLNARGVLNAMEAVGYIDETQIQRAVSQGWQPGNRPWIPIHVGDFWEWVKPEIAALLGGRQGTFIAVTTLNAELQLYAQRAVDRQLRSTSSQGALLATSPEGAVYAMVGGRSDLPRGLNRAVNARRQTGSVFKPVVYLTALEAGYDPRAEVLDQPLNCRGWAPQNFDQRYLGPMSLATALALSRNTVAVDLLQKLGLPQVVDTAQRLGIQGDIDNPCTSALGTDALSLLEVVGAYGVLASGGLGVSPHGLLGVRDHHGQFIHWRGQGPTRQVVAPQLVNQLTGMLQLAVREGTGQAAVVANTTVAGKTGTSSAHRDAWFVGYTPSLVVGVWVGNDNNQAMNGVTGGGLPAQIFRQFVDSAYRFLDFIADPP